MKQNSLFAICSGALCILLFSQCQTTPKKTVIELSNTSQINLTDKAIAIDRSQISDIPKEEAFPLIISTEGDTIASQLDDLNGDGQWDELFFVTDLNASSTKAFTFGWTDKSPKYTIRTSARFGKRRSADTPVEPATSEVILPNDLPKSIGFQKYQTDGPSWENDKVGFRHYLDGRNAKDLFGKRAAYMSPENVGINANGEVEDNYHVMEDWGRDILAVGNSVGLGGYTLLVNEKPLRLGVLVTDSVNNVDKTTFHIVTEGPVKSVLAYNYEGWKPAENRNYEVKETTSIWPGMYAYQNTVEFSNLKGDETLAIGLVNIHNQNPLEEIPVNVEWMVLLTHDMQTYDRGWWLGMAIIVPRAIYEGCTEAPKTGQLTNSFLAKLKVENNKPVTYYAAAGWELSDERFKDRDFWKAYVENLVQQLSAKVDITIK
ncbi:DUF4861 domain-containing protein [Mangrovibacterium lignilyticum]|uniref:DUF4861 domain-containing protein n=1 Tax=Mangrovibacterium lignilyticum TaxID=2668052 RepID=UPI0013D221C4|nr:DUF4861 domain-containing protein [Mangrovibacterium lignilyticum]